MLGLVSEVFFKSSDQRSCFLSLSLARVNNASRTYAGKTGAMIFLIAPISGLSRSRHFQFREEKEGI